MLLKVRLKTDEQEAHIIEAPSTNEDESTEFERWLLSHGAAHDERFQWVAGKLWFPLMDGSTGIANVGDYMVRGLTGHYFTYTADMFAQYFTVTANLPMPTGVNT